MMAGPRNPIVGFEPDPQLPGYGMLQHEDGAQLFGEDPQLAANLAATAPPDARLAGPAFSPEAVPDETAAGVTRLVLASDIAAREQQQQAEAERAAIDAKDAERQRYLANTVPVPFRPGVSKEQREAYAEQGTSTPVAESVQVSGGVEDTPENQEARAEAANEVRFAASAQRDLNVKQLENRSAAAKVEGMQLQEELRDRRTVQTFAKKRVDNMAQMSESAAEAYREHSLKPDPKSPMADIGLALMQAFGAYGASLGGTENFAARIVENAVQREVA
jgi:hypothetical protein